MRRVLSYPIGKKPEDVVRTGRRLFHFQGWGDIELHRLERAITTTGNMWEAIWILDRPGEAVYKCRICRDSGFIPGSGDHETAAEECECQDRHHPYLAFDWHDQIDHGSERF